MDRRSAAVYGADDKKWEVKSVKITLELPDGIAAAFLNGVVWDATGYGATLVSYALDSDDLKDGRFVKLPRAGGADHAAD